MKCKECQFNLLCHAGRLDSWSKDKLSIVQLCPECNRLSVGFDETLYVFACEQRHLTMEQLAQFAQLYANFKVTAMSTVQIADPGPGLIGNLSLGICAACLDCMPPSMRNITIKYLDEQTEETLTERVRQQHAQAISAEGNEGLDDG